MNEPSQKLPILDIIRSAIHFTYMNFDLIFKVAWPWAAVYAVITLIFVWLGIADFLELQELVAFVTEFPIEARRMGLAKLPVLTAQLSTMTSEMGTIIPAHQILDNGIKILSYAAVGVAIIRNFLLNVEPPKIALGLREVKAFAYLLLITFAASGSAVGLALQFIPADMGFAASGIWQIIIGFMLAFILVRFLMVLPAVSENNSKVGLGRSWLSSKGQTWRLFLGLVLVVFSSVPVLIFKLMVSNIALPLYIIWPISLLFSMVMVTFIAVFIAICYQYLILGRKDEIQAPLF